jgi:hypothetical protein
MCADEEVGKAMAVKDRDADDDGGVANDADLYTCSVP